MKWAIVGSQYCWAHQAKKPLLVSAVLGALIGFGINVTWKVIVPSAETKELRAARRQIADLDREVKDTKKSPDFQLFVNGVAITNTTPVIFPTSIGQRTVHQAAVRIPSTGTVQRVILSVRNIGNLPADRFLVTVRLSAGLKYQMGGAWQNVGYVARTPSGFVDDNSQASYFIESEKLIDRGAFLTCDAIDVTIDFSKPVVASLMIEASAVQAEKKRFNLIAEFARGEGPPELIVRQ